MAELDNLSINITASTRSAEASIDNLIEKLTKLNEAFSGLSEVSAYTNSMEQIASSMRSMGEALSTLDITHVKGVASGLYVIIVSAPMPIVISHIGNSKTWSTNMFLRKVRISLPLLTKQL